MEKTFDDQHLRISTQDDTASNFIIKNENEDLTLFFDSRIPLDAHLSPLSIYGLTKEAQSINFRHIFI